MTMDMTFGFYYFFGFRGPPMGLIFIFRRPWAKRNAHGLFLSRHEIEKCSEIYEILFGGK